MIRLGVSVMGGEVAECASPFFVGYGVIGLKLSVYSYQFSVISCQY